MYLSRLELTNFRNYTRLELELSARVHLFQGENAQGKTNLLEVIYYLATTKSPLASSDRQLMSWSADQELLPHTEIDARFVRGQEERTLAFTLVKEPGAQGGNGEDVFKRQLRSNGVARRAIDIIGQLNAVLFLPEDIHLVAGSPGERRRYLDATLCQVDAVYCRTLSRYNRVLRQRNALLKRLREGAAERSELSYWDEQLVGLGGAVLARRLGALAALGAQANAMQQALTDGGERLELVYQNSLDDVSPAEGGDTQTGTESAKRLAERFGRALLAVRRQEIARAVTTLGPHRDDVRFMINGVDATIYGSRGQQRTAALALKLAEVDLMRHETGEMPVLLLDDVLSELDRKRSHLLLQTIQQADQVLITTTDLAHYEPGFLAQAALWHVAQGQVTAVEPMDR